MTFFYLRMSDAPAHELFVLIGPFVDGSRLPEPLCAIQIALEGQISKQSVLSSLSRGQRAAGNLIPWTISQQVSFSLSRLLSYRLPFSTFCQRTTSNITQNIFYESFKRYVSK